MLNFRIFGTFGDYSDWIQAFKLIYREAINTNRGMSAFSPTIDTFVCYK